MNKARLIFENGTVFEGAVFASRNDRYGEVVFNTAMCGYQEVLTDPSYSGQMVVMTYPLIGNYGINSEDVESKSLYLSALLVREYMDFPSNWRSKKSLKTYLEEYNVLGMEGLDTRALTRFIRDKGAQKALVTTSDEPLHSLVQKVKASPAMKGQNLAEKVSSIKSYSWKEKPYTAQAEKSESSSMKNESKLAFKVAVIDCGVKYNILRELTAAGCECEVVPAGISAETILENKFSGVFISNGPGDPEPVYTVIRTIQELIGKIPIFGICLGHQLIGLALGARSYKLKFGHHGVNHPVKNLKTGHVEITSQNHGFCIDMSSLNKDDIEITHVNLNDNTVEGFRHKQYPVFCVQYHPEAGPGPHDSRYLFHEFTVMMTDFLKQKNSRAGRKK
ncbi:glutamine-hydrolyzing carbamoyl-phosphate synthase small subunit [Thermoproteota archaeon]